MPDDFKAEQDEIRRAQIEALRARQTRRLGQSPQEIWHEARGAPGSGLSIPDVIAGVVGETPGEMAFNLAMTPVKGPQLISKAIMAARAAGPATLMADDAEAAGAGSARKALTSVLRKKPQSREVSRQDMQALLTQRHGFDPVAGYPPVAPGVPTVDPKTGRAYTAKQTTPEAENFMVQRLEHQKDIEQGNYTPFFDVSKRSNVDPNLFPPMVDTSQVVPKKPETLAKYAEISDNPAARDRLIQGYMRGLQDPGNEQFYALKQLYDAFIKELGPKHGPRAFEQEIRGWGATTGGQTPTNNLLMGHYGQYMQKRGLPFPSADQIPSPLGGAYISGNLDVFDKYVRGNQPFGLSAPKREDFTGAFFGNKTGTPIDAQMMGAFDPSGKLAAPPGPSYGLFRNVVHDTARSVGRDPRDFQDVTWGGLKDLKDEARGAKKSGGKPAIQSYNEAIERTARLTGLSRDEVLKRGVIRKDIPLYGTAGAAAIPRDEEEGGI